MSTPAFLSRWTENRAILRPFSVLFASEEYYRPFTVSSSIGNDRVHEEEVCFLERHNSDKRYKVFRRKRLCGETALRVSGTESLSVGSGALVFIAEVT